ncbi:arylsulfatase [Ruficoccus sp. ZRK36]|uniref:arylsulfatase n=1 Tax=Ruficoccus sp. ZRK36 TaxID=2866311 RepID=UPI001C72F764|nr:arylsulfatase [Ruficoccus sp. ZRK36]QYY35229.1 arylsulfatase [Ruficoccus sp. ZRK36]
MSAHTAAHAAETSSTEHPNVLLIVTDDQGFGDLSLHGNPYLKTPAMDSLADEGANLDTFYVSPLCAPTRASLLTGRYHPEVGVTHVTRRLEVMDPEETTLAEIFRDNGYATGAFGKWHNGSFYPETPRGQGFDEFYGFPYGHIPHYFEPEIEDNGVWKQEHGYITDLLTDEAMKFMDKESAAGKPFFCYLAYNAPHTPALVSDEYYDRFKAMGLTDKEAAIYGMIAALDDNLARLFEHMQKEDLFKDTIVIFMSDNGPIPERYNANLKGWKGWYDEGGVRVPCFIRWDGHITKGEKLEKRLAHVDILPTLVELCDLKQPKTLPLDGQSFAALLKDPQAPWEDRLLYTLPVGNKDRIESYGSVRNDEWLAVKRENEWELYDLLKDPTQQHNVAAQYPDVLAQLKAAYEKRHGAINYRLDPRPIPVGYEGHPLVRIEAHDALLHPKNGEGIGYNYPAGFAHHWITNWTSMDSYPEWSLNVVGGGTYDVALLYCLPAEDVGVQGEVQVAGQSVAFKLDEAFDPDVYPQPFRLKGEAEKYARKPWKTFPVGTVELEPGPATVRVRLTDIPGPMGMELKAVELRKR